VSLYRQVMFAGFRTEQIDDEVTEGLCSSAEGRLFPQALRARPSSGLSKATLRSRQGILERDLAPDLHEATSTFKASQ